MIATRGFLSHDLSFWLSEMGRLVCVCVRQGEQAVCRLQEIETGFLRLWHGLLCAEVANPVSDDRTCLILHFRLRRVRIFGIFFLELVVRDRSA